MRVEKVINNNIITSFNLQGKEIIVMGCGIGFQKRPGTTIDDEKIEKIFQISDKIHNDQFQQLLQKMPIENIRISDEIIRYAKEILQKELSENIYITLTDHINFAIERYRKEINIENALLWEIKKFYPKEYQVGKAALSIISTELSIELPDDEAGFIALHIVNAQLDTDMSQSIALTKIMQSIISIVKYFYKIDIDENSLNYERFVTHLKFFIQRIYQKTSYQSEDEELYKTIKRQYPAAYECAEKISDFVKQKLDYDLEEEEKIYLTVHIQRITRKKI